MIRKSFLLSTYAFVLSGAAGLAHARSDNVVLNSIYLLLFPDICDSRHFNLCTTRSDCTNSLGYWYNNTCNTSPSDCNGDSGGNAILDNCGNCVGGNTGNLPCVQDCNGEWGGEAITDSRGVCAGDDNCQSVDCSNTTYSQLLGSPNPAAVGNSEDRNAYRGIYWTGESKSICSASIRLQVNGDISGINYKMTVWQVNTQNDLTLGTLLATSETVSGATIATGDWVNFTFADEVDLLSGKTVILVSRLDVGVKDGSNFIQVYQNYDEGSNISRQWNSHYSVNGEMAGRHVGDENQPEYFAIPFRFFGENRSQSGEAPNIPESIDAQASSASTINISWVERGVIPVDHYNIYEYDSNDASLTLLGSVNAPTTQYNHTGLTSGTSHYYVITGVTAAGVEGYHSLDKQQYASEPNWHATTP